MIIKHNRLLERYLRKIYYYNVDQSYKVNKVQQLMFNIKAKSALKKLQKNGVAVRTFMREELHEERNLASQFMLVYNAVSRGYIKPKDIKYVMSLDHYLSGAAIVYPETKDLIDNMLSKDIHTEKEQLVIKSTALIDDLSRVTAPKKAILDDTPKAINEESKSVVVEKENNSHIDELKDYLTSKSQNTNNVESLEEDRMLRHKKNISQNKDSKTINNKNLNNNEKTL